MNINEAHIIYFSPANHTEQVCKDIQKQLIVPSSLHNLTAHASYYEQTFGMNDLAIFAVPSFGGRTPAIALDKFKSIHGNHTPCILLVTYGNRAYEDTLIELYDFVKQQGFSPIGAMAIICEHSIMHIYGSGRPDTTDVEQMYEYLKNLFVRLDNDTTTEISVPGHRPYKELKTIPMVPKAGKDCTKCGACAIQCPMEAIHPDHPQETDTSKCISCMRCVTICPQHARKVNPVLLKGATLKLKKACETRKEIELI